MELALQTMPEIRHNPLVYSSPTITPVSSLSKRDQRAFALHVLYTMHQCEYDCSAADMMLRYEQWYGYSTQASDWLYSLVDGVVAERDMIDLELQNCLVNWRVSRLSVMTLLILRFALYELKHEQHDVAVVINEAVELAHCFAEDDAYKLINGVLERWVTTHKASTPE